MESDIIEDNCESLKSEKSSAAAVVNADDDKNEILEDTSDAKMTLVVTSDDDSKDSARNPDTKMETGQDNTENEPEFFLDELQEGENCVDYVGDERLVESPAEVVQEPMPSTSAAALLEDRRKEEEEIAMPILLAAAEKRKLSVGSSGDDDEDNEFYGFDETTGEPLAGSKNKKAKPSEESEEEDDEIMQETKDEAPAEEQIEEKPEESKPESSSKEEKSPSPVPVPEPEIPESKKLEKESKDDEINKEENENSKTPEPEEPEPIKTPKLSPNDVEDNKATPVVNAKHKSLKDATYRKPFDMGWKREFVYRAISGMSKEKGEVYYITPTGKRLRTKHEVQQNITPGLSLENFTFAKEPLGVGPNEEIIRSAKPSARTPSTDVTLGKRIPKPKVPKGASPPPQGWTPAKAVKSISNAQSPRTSQSRIEETEGKHKSSSKGGKSKKNSSSDQSHPTLQTGDDLPVRKRISRNRNKNSPDVQRPVPAQMQVVQQTTNRSAFETFSSNFFGNISIGYDMMFQVFQYLTVQELLRAACVCRVWYDVAHHRSLWRTVRMKNSQVDDWKGLAETLVKHETKHLDLRKILIASSNIEEMWRSFSKNIKTVVNLEGIELCKCSAKIIENLFLSNPKLKILNALSIKDDVINLQNVNNLDNLEELRLKSVEGLILEKDLSPLRKMRTLRHLGLTSFRHFLYKDIEVLGDMTWLESLELGDCNNFVPEFATEILPKLINLKRLRLEGGQDNCGTFEVLETVSKLHRIKQLELVNFEIKVGFDEKLIKCKNIERLLIIPTYISQSAATNNIVLRAVLRLSSTLRILTWAITLELLRVTSLYVEQYDDKRKDKKFFDESIPVMKPVPGINDENEVYKETSDFAQMEILPLVKVEKILTLGMPTTKFKIVKVPYHSTWRQNLE